MTPETTGQGARLELEENELDDENVLDELEALEEELLDELLPCDDPLLLELDDPLDREL